MAFSCCCFFFFSLSSCYDFKQKSYCGQVSETRFELLESINRWNMNIWCYYYIECALKMRLSKDRPCSRRVKSLTTPQTVDLFSFNSWCCCIEIKWNYSLQNYRQGKNYIKTMSRRRSLTKSMPCVPFSCSQSR